MHHFLTETEESTFSLQKRIITREHRQECYSVVEGIFGNCPSMEGDFIVINFFALVFFTKNSSPYNLKKKRSM